MGAAHAPAWAQVLYGSIVGTVVDSSGAVVPNATIVISSKSTGQTREVKSNEAGQYSIGNVLAGAYDLQVTAAGFRQFTSTDVIANINNVTRIDVKLDVGAATEQITVTAAAALLQSDKADVHVELNTKEVTDLPLAGYRNYQSLINLVPGATPGVEQNSLMGAPARALSTNINGTNRNNNITRLDGAVNLYLWLPHHTAYVAPAETVEAVSVATNNFDAEQGMAGGAAVTVVTKSGTNELHGSVFAFHTNNHLKAKNFFFVGDLPTSSRNMDGFTIGGPIKKNKLFFFGGWEGMRERADASGTYTVPTAAQKQGDFSAFGITIYDPTTGNLATGAGRTPFPNAMIPLSRQSAISRKMQDLLPEPNLSGAASNYFASGTQVFNRDNFDVKVNWNRSDSHSLFTKYSSMNGNVTCDFALGEAGGGALGSCGAPGNGHTLTQIATIGHTWTMGRFIVDGTVGWTRMSQEGKNPDYGTNFGSDVLGIPGTNGSDERQSGMPSFIVSGYTTFGNGDNPRPNVYHDQSYTTSHNLSFVSGAHELRFGFDMVRHQLNHWQPELNNPRGAFTFGGGVTALNGGAAVNQFNNYATYLLGLPTTVGKSLQYLTMTGREWQFGWYARDRWQVTPHLTLSLGLRYEYYPLMTRADRGLERYDPATNTILIGGRGGNPDNVGIDVSKRFFGPRIGFAYRLGESTVFRSGYGITYDPLPFSRPLRGPYPATISQNFVGPNSYVPFGTLENGIPYFTGPDINAGTVSLPGTVDDRSPWGGRLHRGYIQSWNFIVERKLPGDLAASLGYVGTQTVHALADRDINASEPGQGNSGRPLNVLFGRTAATTMWDGFLSANYHAFQTSLNRRFRGGLLIRGAYTFSKAINSTDEDGWASLTWNSTSVASRNRALAGYDRTHIFQIGYVFDLPVGPGKSFATGSGPASWLVRNWQLNGTFSSYSGAPFTATADGTFLNAPGNSQTADQVKNEVVKLGGIGRNVPFYDPLAFRSVRDVRYGSTGRNILRGPGVVNADMSIFRSFTITERFNLQFRAEGFNITNTPHFSNPGTNVSNMLLNLDDTIRNLGNFLSVTSATSDERNFRFGLRLSF